MLQTYSLYIVESVTSPYAVLTTQIPGAIDGTKCSAKMNPD